MSSQAEVRTIEIPDKQYSSYHPDNQEGLEPSQVMETQRDAGADHDDVKPEEKVVDDDAEKKRKTRSLVRSNS